MPNKIEVTATPSDITIAAGDTAEVIATLRNTGQTVDQLTLSIDGLEPSWYTLPVSSVALFPNDQDGLKIILHPTKEAESKAGSYPFRINITSQENPDEIASADLNMEIKALLELELDISPQSTIGRKGTYQIVAVNPSSSDTTVNLSASDNGKKLKYQFRLDSLTVPGDGRAGTTLDVQLGWLALIGGDKAFDFVLAASLPGKKQAAAVDFCPYCGHKLEPDPQGTRTHCPYCGHTMQTAEETGISKTVTAQLIRTAWHKNLPRIRIPGFSRSPLIKEFTSSTEDKREFKLAWVTKRSRDIKLNDEEIPAKGEKLVRPTEVTTYSIEARNKRGSITESIEVQPLPVPKEKTSERIRVSLTPAELKASAGIIPAQTVLHIQNLGEIVDKFSVEIEGIDESWYSRSASSIALMPQANDQVQITFQPPKKEGVKSGEYTFGVTVRSQSNMEESTTIVNKLQVLPAPEFKLEVRPVRINCRRKGTYRISLTNTGVSNISYDLEAIDMEEGCKFKFKDYDSLLAAWKSTEVPLIVKPKRGWFVGKQKPFDITVSATDAEGNTQKASCQLTHNPLIGSWKTIFKVIRAIVVIAAIAVLAYFVIQWGGGWEQLTSDPTVWAEELTDEWPPWQNVPR
ncbi:MAG: hypothetical protein SVM79_00295 [Chloroflexota bacterium]|nr:hypothetical protein [Chloroflexota bacterium]